MKPAPATALLQALSAGEFHSGESLASTLGITRAALHKRIQSLRDAGVTIAAKAGNGYRLAHAFEPLDADQISAQITQPCDINVLWSTDSTNSAAWQQQALNLPQLVVAEQQTAGRGRQGKAWHSGLGQGIWMSLRLRLACPAARLSGYSLTAAMSVIRALRVPELKAKWPNDLVMMRQDQWHKLGGLLIELRAESESSVDVVIGIGINIATPTAPLAAQALPAVGLADIAPTINRNTVIARIADALITDAHPFAEEGFAAFQHRWPQIDALRHQPITVIEGENQYRGIAKGVDHQGLLRVTRGNGKTDTVSMGEVSIRPEGGS